ncbi:MAG: AmmeMemoRadiSam system radical SAM enzyme [Candidatus Hydrogenedentes bacterium]|nr:AmmeMemoRadiSam system radical SAM enzyme [Candidatus Hydrogenedentota bacterium]
MDVQCELCPKGCVISPGQSGDCRIRVNLNGKLVAVTYGHPCAVHVDPVEKKPLFHFLPGSKAFSIATVGCNLHCKFCQNWEISQENPENMAAQSLPPQSIPEAARRSGCRSVAYTYSEPLAYYEYTLDSCIKSREAGLKNLLITAGYINQPPLERLCAYLDAANIDVKAYSETFYRDICGATLKPVLDGLVLTKSKGVLVEVTNLVVPTLNDSDDDLRNLCRWIVENLGRETPLHFSRFFPLYRMDHLPPTPAATLARAREIAGSEGLFHVYIGNIETAGAEDTYCSSCGRKLVERRQYTILKDDVADGACPYCSTKVHGLWN